MVAASALYGITALRTSGDTIKEDVSQIITNIAPVETPVMSSFRQGRATAEHHEWLRDTLADAVNNNAHVDGDAFGTSEPGDTTTSPFRLGNYCQISKKQINLSGRAMEGLDLHGRKSAMGYQLSKKAPELKRDMEFSMTSTNAARAESGTVPALSAGIGTWLATNTDEAGTAGALSNTTYGEPTTARVDGTDRALSEATLLAQIQAAWTAGGKIDRIFVTPANKANLSAYFLAGPASGNARIAAPRQDFGSNPDKGVTVAGSVDVWKSDFGVHLITPCRQMRDDDVLALDTSKWKICFLRKYRVEKLAKLGDNERRHLLVDWTLESCDEEASAGVFDIDETAAVTA